MERRDFIKTAAAAGVAAAIPAAAQKAAPVRRPEAPGMLYNELGTTGERVSRIGLGGAHIGYGGSDDSAVRLMHAAIDGGITFFDNCWDYNNGNSEVRMGKALAQGGYRQRVFLMTKTDSQTAALWTQQLDESLRRLQTDHIDLVQFHEVIRMGDPERIFGPGGAVEAAVKAREAGKIRFIGFTGHKDPSIHLHMLETARQHKFHFDTVQMPVNVMDAHFRSFAHQVIPVAQRDGVGVLGMKCFGSGSILKSGVVQPMECLHYSLSQPVNVVITGIDRQEILDQALTAARTFKPLTTDETRDLMARTEPAARDGQYELFKISPRFDGTVHNPQWLG